MNEINEISKTVRYYALRIVRRVPGMEYSDASQMLYESFLKRRDKFDSKKSCINTFASRQLSHTKKHIEQKEIKERLCMSYIDFSELPLTYDYARDWDNKIQLDIIEKALKNKKGVKACNALKIFELMRQGYTKADCAKELGFTRGYISRLFKEQIQKTAYDIL